MTNSVQLVLCRVDLLPLIATSVGHNKIIIPRSYIALFLHQRTRSAFTIYLHIEAVLHVHVPHKRRNKPHIVRNTKREGNWSHFKNRPGNEPTTFRMESECSTDWANQSVTCGLGRNLSERRRNTIRLDGMMESK